MSRRIRLKVAYDGSAYHGWQFQEGIPTIEGVLDSAVSECTGEEIHVIGASRTDAGVHAMGNIAVFDTDSPIPPDKMYMVLNKILPDDISILSSDEVPSDWHPRRQNCKKTYEYHIYTSPVRIPVKRLYAYYCYQKLNTDDMNKGALAFIGEHDFTAFCAADSQATTFVRTIYDCSVRSEGDEVIISVTGSGFLYNMVRIIAGTLLDVGTGRKKAEEIESVIKSKDRRAAGPTLPPQGLILISYEYENCPLP